MKPNPIFQSVRVLGLYIRAQFLIAGIETLIYAAGFALARVPFWFALAPLAGLLFLIPIIGPLMALGLVELVCVIDHAQDYQRLLWVLAIWVLVQGFEGFYLSPRLLGRTLGLHWLAIFTAILLGSLLFGPLGVVLAVPVLAVAAVFWRYFEQKRAAKRPA